MPNQKKKVLIIEDERAMVKALELKLGAENFAVKAAFDGEEALKILSKEKFDLVLLDLILPKKDGFEVLAEMRGRGNNTPVVVLSNLGQPEDLKRAENLGANNYFVKIDTPITELIEIIKKMFAAQKIVDIKKV